MPAEASYRGFTLIELILVIVVLGILSAFALPRLASFGDQATQTQLDALGADYNRAGRDNVLNCRLGRPECTNLNTGGSDGSRCSFNNNQPVGQLARAYDLPMAQNLPADENWTVNNNPNRDYTARLEFELVANGQPTGQMQVCFLGRN